MSLNSIKLAELIVISKGRKAPETFESKIPGAKRYIQINDLRSDEKLAFAIDLAGVEVGPNDLCIAWDGANAGTVGYGLSGLIGSTIARLRPTEANVFFTPYAGRFLQSKFQFLNAGTTGATIPHVSKDKLLGLEIPLPSLSEQRRIAAILDKADAIRRKRQEAIRLTEELLRSAFLEMFGDPVANPKGWPERRLEEITDIQSGVTKGRKLDGQKTVTVPYMRVANVQDGHITLNEIKEIEVLPADVQKFQLRPGDVLLTEGGDPDKLGRGAVWGGEVEPCIHQNHIFRVRPNLKVVLPEFLSTLIGSARGKKYFLRAAKQTTGIASINKTQLSNFPALLPPLELQRQFAELVKQQERFHRKLVGKQQIQETLFNSLIQRAFRGELVPHDASDESIPALLECVRAERDAGQKVLPMRRKQREEPAPAEPKRHAGHDMYNKAALAAYITAKCHAPQHPMGKTKLAKLFFLAQRKADIALTETFARRAAGPLDDAIHKFLPLAQKQGWVKVLPKQGPMIPIVPGRASEVAVQQSAKRLGAALGPVDEMLETMKAWKWQTLECWATVEPLARELLAASEEPTVAAIKTALDADPTWRPKLEKEAFSDANLAAALRGLYEQGFLQMADAGQAADGEPLPLIAETADDFKTGGQAGSPAANQPVPQRILAAMHPGRDHSRAELLAATGISETEWTWAIRQLKEQGKVVQRGEKRGARYLSAEKPY